jgi:hypothetical protein
MDPSLAKWSRKKKAGYGAKGNPFLNHPLISDASPQLVHCSAGKTAIRNHACFILNKIFFKSRGKMCKMTLKSSGSEKEMNATLEKESGDLHGRQL